MSFMNFVSKRRAPSLLPWLAGIATVILFSELLPSSALRLHFKDGFSPEVLSQILTPLTPQQYQNYVAHSNLIAGSKEETGPRQQRYSHRQLRRLDEETSSSASSGSSSSLSSSTPSPTPSSSVTAEQTNFSTPSPTAAASSAGTVEDTNNNTTSSSGSTLSPSSASTTTAGEEESVNGPTPSPTEATSSLSEEPEEDDDGSNKVATPYFADDSTTYIMSYTLHIMCDTEGAIIRYTLDGTDPAPGGEDGKDESPTAREVLAGESELVQQIGTITIRAVAMKEGMHVSDEISKTVTVTELVADPELYFEGEEAQDNDYDNAFLRSVTIVMNCSTPNTTIRYTTDGSSPDEDSTGIVSGSRLEWPVEGVTKFNVGAFAEGLYRSNVKSWVVKIVAPMTDEYQLADGSSSEDGNGDDMAPIVEVTPFKAVYAAPGAELEQEEHLGPGYGGECEGGARVVTGKLLRVFNPNRHVSFAAPLGACGDEDDDGDDNGDSGEAVLLAMAAETAEAFEQPRETVTPRSSESPEDARVRLDLDAREEAWQAAGGDGCQAVAPGGLLWVGGGGVGGGCVVGHLVSGGRVVRAEKESGLVSFGIRGGNFVVGVITEEEVLDQGKPFQELVSGAGWLVRDGVNHVEASARDGHMDVLREGGGAEEEEKEGEGLDDVMAAKLARTAIGHDSEGRLMLLQTSGAFLGSDQDTAIPDGLSLSELADVLVEAGALNAVNLVSGAPAALTVNGSAVVDPAEACSSDYDNDGSFVGFVSTSTDDGGGSVLPRCERPVSSIVCVHLDPPPIVSGYEGTPSPAAGHGAASVAYDEGINSSLSSSSWGGGWSSDDDGEEKMRLQWTHELCSGNGTELWRHLDDVEEALFRYRIAFWVAAILGMISLFLNIQRHKRGGRPSRHGASAAAGNGGAPYGNVSLVNGAVVGKPELEMGKMGSKRAPRKGGSNRRKGSSNRGGAYAPVNGDMDWNGNVVGGMPHSMDSEEEVDLGLGAPPRGSSSGRKKDKSKSSRLRRALAKVAKGGGASAGRDVDAVPGEGDLDATMPINPFGGRDNGRADYDDEEGAWA